jgi:hypothetical protein
MPGPGQTTRSRLGGRDQIDRARLTRLGAGGSAAAERHQQPRWLVLQRALTAVTRGLGIKIK